MAIKTKEEVLELIKSDPEKLANVYLQIMGTFEYVVEERNSLLKLLHEPPENNKITYH